MLKYLIFQFSFLFFSFCPFFIMTAQDPLLQGSEQTPNVGFSANPGSVNLEIGTGAIGEALGFSKESGVRIGGLLIEDYSYQLAGGLKPHKGGEISVFMLSLNLDTQKLKWWKGGLFCATFLRYDGRDVNVAAGSIQGYNSLYAIPPFSRSELYQLWYRQDVTKKFFFRIGKMVTTYDFGNVLRSLPFKEEHLSIPANSGLTYNPVFIFPSLLGVEPGFYNSAYGITLTVLPNDSTYVSYGGYDGNLARGKNTGMRGPQFNGYYFHILETGWGWIWGEKKMAGNFSIGAWYQSGKLSTATAITEKGASGLYLFGSQRLWQRNPGVDNSGMVGFIQMGTNHSKTLPINHFVGGGLTFFGLLPGRKNDSFGLGCSWARLNPNVFIRKSEFMAQVYHQIVIYSGIIYTTSLSWIPNPGAAPHLPASYAITGRLIGLF